MRFHNAQLPNFANFQRQAKAPTNDVDRARQYQKAGSQAEGNPREIALWRIAVALVGICVAGTSVATAQGETVQANPRNARYAANANFLKLMTWSWRQFPSRVRQSYRRRRRVGRAPLHCR